MLRSRVLFVPAALLLATGVAGAQRSPGSPGSHGSPPAARPTGAVPHVRAAAWNGTPSKWGGSPPERRHDGDRGQRGFAGQPGAYIPIAVAAPYPVPAAADTACSPAPGGSVEMPVVTTRHEERQLTTIEVYRLQPRFQKP